MELKVKEMEGQNARLLTELHAEKQGKEKAEGKDTAKEKVTRIALQS